MGVPVRKVLERTERIGAGLECEWLLLKGRGPGLRKGGGGGTGWRDRRADSDGLSSSISVSLLLICYDVNKRVAAFTGRSWSCPHAFPWVTR